MTTKEYMQGIIDANPIEKILPMTHRNNHGIKLIIWQELFTEYGIATDIEDYIHTTYSADNGKQQTTRQQLIVIN